MKRYSAAVEAAGLVTLFRGIYKGVFFECTIICKWRKLLVVVIGIAGELYRGPARRGGGGPISPVWILKRLVSVFLMLVTHCRLCHHCHNLSEAGCLLSWFHFTCCCYFLGQVACRNLPLQGLSIYIYFSYQESGSETSSTSAMP